MNMSMVQMNDKMHAVRAVYTSGVLTWFCTKPLAVFSAKNGFVKMTDVQGKEHRIGKRLSARVILDEFQRWYKNIFTQIVSHGDSHAIPFTGGPVGFLSYEFGVALMEQRCRHPDDLSAPDLYFFIPGAVWCKNSETGAQFFVGWGRDAVAAESAFYTAKDAAVRGDFFNEDSVTHAPVLHPEMTRSVYDEGIVRIKEYLKSGETYQVNFAQRFFIENAPHGAKIFQNLLKINPSPHMFYCGTDEWAVVSNSPEQLLSVTHDGERWIARTSPIKGTIARGANDAEDESATSQLLASEKDAAELVMIVDLCRNDIGRVCVSGSVTVPVHRALEPYSHLWHTVSTVEGVLRDNCSALDALVALFPGGSVTGCPKYRTVHIIDHLEPVRRGVYTGSAGFIDFRGGCDFNILIRTIWQHGDRAWFHVGGGIVFDSTAAGEYQETLDKAQALVRACGV